jgi:hypothetical protein
LGCFPIGKPITADFFDLQSWGLFHGDLLDRLA